MSKKGGSPMLSDSNAASVTPIGMPSGNQNEKAECGYVGGGSMPLSSEAWTKSEHGDISGGN
jgi:hypothetical protein